MRMIKGKEILSTICVSYTILSIGNAIFNLLNGYESISNWNALFMLLWTSIAVCILSFHYLFNEFSSVVMIVIQYVMAAGLVILSVFVTGLVGNGAVDFGGYRNAIANFTGPYIIGAGVYYVSLFREAKRQDKLLQEIQERHGVKMER